jgi:hypothetical protein
MPSINIVIGTPRSGSTQMSHAVSLFGKLALLNEPSNVIMPSQIEDGYLDADFERLEVRNKIIANEGRGVNWYVDLLIDSGIEVAKLVPLKHHTSTTWVSIEDISDLISHPLVDRVVLTHRENIFKQNVSYCISRKLNFFHGDKNTIRKTKIGAIDPDVFRWYLRVLDNHSSQIKLLSKNKKCKLCKYEDFYSINGEQEQHWKGLFAFLGHDYDVNTMKIVNRKRYNGPDTYSKIDNMQELRGIFKEMMNESC